MNNVFMEVLRQYLAREKMFIANPERMPDVNRATEMAEHLFPEATITIEDDPLQMGALILCIEDFDFTVRETKCFNTIVGKADNFEIYPTDDQNVKIAIVFQNALTLIKT